MNGGLIFLGILLAFFAILAVFFLSGPLAIIAGVAGFAGHALISLQLMGNPLAAADYAVTRAIVMAISFALVWILTGTVFIAALPTFFVIGAVFTFMAAIFHIIRTMFFSSLNNFVSRKVYV